jgi:hypothetical protein
MHPRGEKSGAALCVCMCVRVSVQLLFLELLANHICMKFDGGEICMPAVKERERDAACADEKCST